MQINVWESMSSSEVQAILLIKNMRESINNLCSNHNNLAYTNVTALRFQLLLYFIRKILMSANSIQSCLVE